MTPTVPPARRRLLAALAATARPRPQGQRRARHGAEPAPGLDPTMASAAAIGEMVHLDILEG